MNINDTLSKAFARAGLDTRSGTLKGVTDTIRKALASAGLGGGSVATPADADVIEVTARDISAKPKAKGVGQFVARTLNHPAGVRDYKLYRPAARAGAPKGPRPLVVMLHGCTQSAEDFAAGTQMNRLADEHGFLVLYPEQSASANASRCWNWFRPQDQVREGGEPALIAAMVQAVIKEQADEQPVDTKRVFVAGLSAGAAMAVILGETWPDLFAAVGAHSGLPFAAAHDIPSAMAAMKGRGVMGGAHFPGTAADPRRSASHAVPTIVFHGDRDHTVQHSNGKHITEQARHAEQPLSASSETGTAAGGRRYTREVHADAAGRAWVEQWTVHGAGHAWSGGDAAGSYTDNAGPDASAEMLRFFLAQSPRG
ncbi:PHB depolymerase family esterase [Hydrogenophaga sp.]|uniref:extracellular catalytic domain type 1 short-chain-length polyhydroxyalkanoate depolymerase n=1 Tax=Hydrogenophaga sp. TaxID=1904254 RepID=UPI002730E911|nr:PHB depolymerase family esterase [Hydrogenophaga sp.]MDP2018264.1 PHB depolymerase family esterase [Hydrogenophaga sp.]MDP3810476.1 PHB depolymerase family esterase [Hydrogenophaga sp.]